jgi:hypothetical protein
MKKHPKSVLLGAALLIAAAAFAQGQKKAPASPPASTSVTIGGKALGIKYAAPSLRGRQFIGGLHQYGQVWRAGANNATAFHTDAELDLGGLSVPKGDYTLYVLLDAAQWQLIVNKQTGQWGTEYNQGQDLGRIKMTMSKPPSPIETFKITLSEKGGNKGQLQMEWENSIATVPFTVK